MQRDTSERSSFADAGHGGAGALTIPWLTYSVGLRARQDRDIERDVAALVEAVGQTLQEQFPDAAGYDTACFRLSGPIEGATLKVTRGRFRATVSVQRFARAHAAPDPSGGPDPRALEVRLVATADVAPPAGSAQADAHPHARRTPGASLAVASCAALCALGTAAFGTLALAAAGLLTASMQALLVLPTFLVWRATLALAHAPSAPVAALPAVPGRPRPRPRDPTVRDAIARWRRALVQLEAHRQLLEESSSRAPFRVSPRSLGATG